MNKRYDKFSLTEKIFLELNPFLTSLVKPLLSRNFCQKRLRQNFCNFLFPHCVWLRVNFHYLLIWYEILIFPHNKLLWFQQCEIDQTYLRCTSKQNPHSTSNSVFEDFKSTLLLTNHKIVAIMIPTPMQSTNITYKRNLMKLMIPIPSTMANPALKSL